MSDARWREAERAFRESGGREAEALYLVEATRAGALEARRIEQCADLGYPPARLALGQEPLEDAEIEGLGSLLRNRWGQWLLVEASLALTRALRPPEEFASGPGLLATEALSAVGAWLALPERPQVGPVRTSLRAVDEPEFATWAGEAFAGALLHTLRAVSWPPPRGSWSTVGYLAPWHALSALGRPRWDEVLALEVVPGLLQRGAS